ncbi:MAG: phosphate signaling complex protein PhoU [Desulfonatronovibrionaceae bacterium]
MPQTHLSRERDQLKMLVLEMVSKTTEAAGDSLEAFAEMDTDKAQTVIDSDNEINELEVSVDEKCLRLLALEGPVAGDLRFILGCMRVSMDLERIGDEAANIAQDVVVLSLKPSLDFYHRLTTMGYKALEMLKLAGKAFAEEDTDQAVRVCRMDNEVDELNSAFIKQVIGYMGDHAPAIERSVRCINVARRMERIGDLATNIAENTVFISRGVNIKHYCQFDNR